MYKMYDAPRDRFYYKQSFDNCVTLTESGGDAAKIGNQILCGNCSNQSHRDCTFLENMYRAKCRPTP